MVDIAAALAAQSRDGEDFLMSPGTAAGEAPSTSDRRPTGPAGRSASPTEGFATYRIEVGKRHKVMPGAIVGAIANEGGLHRSDFGHITHQAGPSRWSSCRRSCPRETLKALEKTRISGVLINLQPDGRPGPPDRLATAASRRQKPKKPYKPQ